MTEGTAEEFGLLYVPATSSESLEIGGRAVVKEIEGLSDEVQVIRYVFQSPVDESVRVVAFDYISGFPERAAGHEVVIEIVEQVLATVEFTP